MLTVSVIIPVLNEEVAVAAAIASAHAADADEVFVVDGGSTDNTVSVARKDATLLEAPSAGRSAQQNLGATYATGDVLLFLHADCCLHVDGIRKLKERMQADPTLVAGCFRQRIDKPGFAYSCLEQGNYLRAAVLNWAYGDQAIFVRTEVFNAVGQFPQVKFMEDLLIMKVLRKQGRVRVIDSPLLVSARRWERRGILRQTVRNWCLITAAQLGVSPNWLARFYPNDR